MTKKARKQTPTKLSDLTADPKNARRHTPRNISMIADSLKAVGGARSIVIDERGHVLAGNATVEAAAKAGVHALTRCAAVEAAELEVRVNCVAPTLALHANITRVADPAHLAAMTALQPQARAAEPWEIAATIAFLASDLSSYLTGECLSASSQRP